MGPRDGNLGLEKNHMIYLVVEFYRRAYVLQGKPTIWSQHTRYISILQELAMSTVYEGQEWVSEYHEAYAKVHSYVSKKWFKKCKKMHPQLQHHQEIVFESSKSSNMSSLLHSRTKRIVNNIYHSKLTETISWILDENQVTRVVGGGGCTVGCHESNNMFASQVSM